MTGSVRHNAPKYKTYTEQLPRFLHLVLSWRSHCLSFHCIRVTPLTTTTVTKTKLLITMRITTSTATTNNSNSRKTQMNSYRKRLRYQEALMDSSGTSCGSSSLKDLLTTTDNNCLNSSKFRRGVGVWKSKSLSQNKPIKWVWGKVRSYLQCSRHNRSD